MHKLIPLLALVAMPAAAQPASVAVSPDGQACTLSAKVDATNTLMVRYDAAREDITLSSANEVLSPLPPSGALDFTLVFLGNGEQKWDDGWDTRRFNYSRDGNMVRFSTHIAGKRNVEQLLADLANSRRLGFLDKGQPVIDYDLAGMSAGISQLKDCAARASGRPA